MTTRSLFRPGALITFEGWKEREISQRLSTGNYLTIKTKVQRHVATRLNLQNNHWLTLLNPITSLEEINELVHLGSKLQVNCKVSFLVMERNC
uniref:Uncharacterized protein n=1 Tax=Oryza punctata TaxID=4537 RepID=A0A0E0LSB7_ORYPU